MTWGGYGPGQAGDRVHEPSVLPKALGLKWHCICSSWSIPSACLHSKASLAALKLTQRLTSDFLMSPCAPSSIFSGVLRKLRGLNILSLFILACGPADEVDAGAWKVTEQSPARGAMPECRVPGLACAGELSDRESCPQGASWCLAYPKGCESNYPVCSIMVPEPCAGGPIAPECPAEHEAGEPCGPQEARCQNQQVCGKAYGCRETGCDPKVDLCLEGSFPVGECLEEEGTCYIHQHCGQSTLCQARGGDCLVAPSCPQGTRRLAAQDCPEGGGNCTKEVECGELLVCQSKATACEPFELPGSCLGTLEECKGAVSPEDEESICTGIPDGCSGSFYCPPHSVCPDVYSSEGGCGAGWSRTNFCDEGKSCAYRNPCVPQLLCVQGGPEQACLERGRGPACDPDQTRVVHAAQFKFCQENPSRCRAKDTMRWGDLVYHTALRAAPPLGALTWALLP